MPSWRVKTLLGAVLGFNNRLPSLLFRLVERLRERGYDALHTREPPWGNATPDREICALSLRERRVVVTKDGDFAQDLLLRKEPCKLLLISTGNIRNRDLEELFLRNAPTLAALLKSHTFVELGRDFITVHF